MGALVGQQRAAALFWNRRAWHYRWGASKQLTLTPAVPLSASWWWWLRFGPLSLGLCLHFHRSRWRQAMKNSRLQLDSQPASQPSGFRSRCDCFSRSPARLATIGADFCLATAANRRISNAHNSRCLERVARSVRQRIFMPPPPPPLAAGGRARWLARKEAARSGSSDDRRRRSSLLTCVVGRAPPRQVEPAPGRRHQLRRLLTTTTTMILSLPHKRFS